MFIDYPHPPYPNHLWHNPDNQPRPPT
ncbi:hypothetical protein J0S82_008256 [Galemys pyrenaicus]|uniref:Uncharacterized protein n=1 Tax=Galemys pyrenaicus TaxID=202257 RepID=A0A8J6ACZ7_GALPY|nr:hypothetical protein J0S82_008256 [Galemys pyrenaicus]